MSQKYNFAFDMESGNFNSLILRRNHPDSDVLEADCAHGRTMKNLKDGEVYQFVRELRSA
jgi:hypothetical protein